MNTQLAPVYPRKNPTHGSTTVQPAITIPRQDKIAQAMRYWRSLPASATNEKAAAATIWDGVAAQGAETANTATEAEQVWKMSPEHGHAREVALARWITLATKLSKIKTILNLTEDGGELRNIALLKYIAATDNPQDLQAIKPLTTTGTTSEEALRQKLQKLM